MKKNAVGVTGATSRKSANQCVSIHAGQRLGHEVDELHAGDIGLRRLKDVTTVIHCGTDAIRSLTLMDSGVIRWRLVRHTDRPAEKI